MKKIGLCIFLLFFAIPVHASPFVGIPELRKIDCSSRSIELNNHIDIADSINNGDIRLNPRDMAKISETLQKFIFAHECGHTKGYFRELSADLYAWQHYGNKHLTREDLKEYCYLLKDDTENGPHGGADRCKQMTNLFNGKK